MVQLQVVSIRPMKLTLRLRYICTLHSCTPRPPAVGLLHRTRRALFDGQELSFCRQHPRPADVPQAYAKLQLWRSESREGSGRDAIMPLIV